MNGKHYVGKRLTSFELLNEIGPVTGVALLLDDENEIFAGDDTGYVMEIECPYATETMAQNILTEVQGGVYKGYRGDDAVLKPGAELGDGITVNGLYSVLADLEVTFGPGHMSDISAPSESEAEHEYSYVGTVQKIINRKTAQTRALIEKTAEEIRLSVSEVSDDLSTLEGSVSELSVKLGSITLSVSNGVYSSTIKLMAGETEISSEQISFSGMVSFYDLKTSGSTVINGDNITTGTIEGRTFRSILDAAGGVGGEIEMCYLDNTSIAGGIRLDDQGAGTDSDRQYRMFLYTEESNGIAFALKLKSASGMSLEAEENIYIDAGTKVTIYGANITAATNGRFILNGGTVEIGGAVSFSGSVDFSGATVTGLPEADTTTEEETT